MNNWPKDSWEEPRRNPLPDDLPPLPEETEEASVAPAKGIHPNRRAREAVLAALYAYGRQAGEREAVMTDAIRRYKLRKGQVDLFTSLFKAVLDNQGFLDREIGAVLENWTVGRLAEIERLLLRMGAAELLLLRNLDRAIPINETVQLAKTFGDADSGRFVNGVLDALGKDDIK